MRRTIIITGATGKFGKILVKNFLKKGDIIIAVGRSKKKLNQLKTYESNKNQNLFLACVDLMKENANIKIIKEINHTYEYELPKNLIGIILSFKKNEYFNI